MKPTFDFDSVPDHPRYAAFPPAKSENPDEALNGAFVVRVISRVTNHYYIGRSMVDTSSYRTLTAGMPRSGFEQELALQLVKNAERILTAREPAAMATTICQRKAVDLYRHHLVISKHETHWTDEALDAGRPVQDGTSLGTRDENFCEPASEMPSGRTVWKADRIHALWHPKQEHRKNPEELWRKRILAVENEKRLKMAWAAFNLLTDEEVRVLLFAYGFAGSDITGQIVKRSAREIAEIMGLQSHKVVRIIRRAERVLQEACGERPLKRLRKTSNGSLERVDYQVPKVFQDTTVHDNNRETTSSTFVASESLLAV